MTIQHNIEAMNAYRQMNITGGTLAKSARNLSSGYRINIAADDAAGLSISEKMRKQIRGLDKGVENTEDGVSLCQVADGALSEVHDMLQRLNELAIKAKNGTNSVSDRRNINDEVTAVLKEIDRIGDTTRFNEVYIFKGQRPKKTKQVTVSSTTEYTVEGKFFQVVGKNNTSDSPYMEEPISVDTMKTYITTSTIDGTNDYVTVHADFAELIDKKNGIKQLVGAKVHVNCCTNCCKRTLEFTDDSGVTSSGGTISIGVKKDDGSYYDSANEFVNAVLVGMQKPENNIGHVEFACDPGGTTLYLYDIDNNNWSQDNKEKAVFCDVPGEVIVKEEKAMSQQVEDSRLWIQSGCDALDGMVMDIGTMNTAVLDIDDIDVLTEDCAEDAINRVSEAIDQISKQRSRIGAYQNRLEHTIANEDNIIENTTDAESKIRDTDMAAEMVRYSNANIIMQAGQSMLSQANQTKQGILSLLAA